MMCIIFILLGISHTCSGGRLQLNTLRSRYELVLYCSAHVACHMHGMQLQTCKFISLLLSVFS